MGEEEVVEIAGRCLKDKRPGGATVNPETETRLRERASRDGADLNELADALLSNVLVDDPHRMTKSEIEASYRATAADEEREAEAMEWAEGITIRDFSRANSFQWRRG